MLIQNVFNSNTGAHTVIDNFHCQILFIDSQHFAIHNQRFLKRLRTFLNQTIEKIFILHLLIHLSWILERMR